MVSRELKTTLALRSWRVVAIALAITILATLSCGSKPQGLRLSPNDINALKNIDDTSSWIVRYTRVALRVREGGALEIAIEGNASPKPGAQGPLWMPILLSRDLPEYFESTEPGSTTELETYRLGSGIWCITAVGSEVPPAPQLPENQVDGPVGSRAFKLHLLLFSKRFLSELPFLLPAGQGRESVALSISLPKGSQFSSLQIGATEEAARSLSPEFPSTTPAVQWLRLPILPAAMADGGVTAGTRLHPDVQGAWDFSGISFHVALTPGLRSWFLPVAFFIAFAALAMWVWAEWARRAAKGLSHLHDSRGHLISDLESDLANIIDVKQTSGTENLNAEVQQRWKEVIYDIQKRVSKVPVFDTKNWEKSLPTEKLGFLAQVRSKLARLDKINAALDRTYFKRDVAHWTLWALCACALASVIWILVELARADTLPKPAQLSVASQPAILCDLGITVAPQDLHSADYEKVSVGLRFSPLTAIRTQGEPSEVDVGVGNSKRLIIAPLQLPANSVATVIQQTDKMKRVRVPANYSAMLTRFIALAHFGVDQFQPPDDYLKSLDAASQVNFSYLVEGAQRIHEHAGTMQWLNLFPFDNVDLEVPLDFRGAAVVSRIEVQLSSQDYRGDISADGLGMKLVLSEDGRKYTLPIENSRRIAMWPGKPVTVRATLERSWLQRYGLTIGVLIVGVCYGLFLGWAVTKPSDGWAKWLIGVLGVGPFPLAIRAAILTAYKDLPTILTGQGTTIFELVFIASMIIIFAMVAKRAIWP